MKEEKQIRHGYKFRIYPTEEQKVFFAKHFGCSRFIYNYLLGLRKEAYDKYKINISGIDAKKEIAVLKKQEKYKWLEEVNSQSLQEASIDLEKAYQRFFKNLGGYPKFKKKKNEQKFKAPQHFYLRESRGNNWLLIIPKLKSDIKVNLHRKIEGEIKQITITKTPAGKYYASFNCIKEKIEKRKAKTGDSIGIDLGLESFITTDKGEKKKAPKYLRELERKLKKEQRSLSRKKKFSNNFQKQRRKVAVIHERIASQRLEFLHQISFKIINENQIIYLEDLNVKGMMKNRHLSKSIADASWGEFTRQLKYKAEWLGREIVQIGRFEASSKICSKCGWKNEELRLNQRMWLCLSCKTIHDRDINAARNIKKLGQDMSKVKPVEKPAAVFSFKKKQAGSEKQEPVLEDLVFQDAR